MNRSITLCAIIAAGLIAILSATSALADDQSNCTPSKWGPDDEIGAANLVTPERTLQALKLVKQGISHPLGIVIGPTTPAYPPRSISLQVVSPGQHNGRSLEGDFGWNVTYNDDLAQLWFGIGSQIDGFGHLGEGGMYYNCNHARDFVNVSGLNKLGTHNIPPIVARGVVVDMARHKGVDALAGGQPISSADIRAAAAAQGVEFREGDVILIHTGRLAREGVHEFLFVLGQARIKGTVQMIINPVAMW